MGTLVEHISESLPVIGYLTLLYWGYKIVGGFYGFLNMYLGNEIVDFKRLGEWALVTGATDGIGKGIAFSFAKRGMSIILVSRNSDKLKKVASEIEEKFHVRTKCVPIDFSKPEELLGDGVAPSKYDDIATAVEGLEIGVLVNNVGLGASGEFLNAFSKSDNKDLSTGIPRLIYCNDLSMARVMGIVLPQMVKRRTGLVLNVSSLAAVVVMPLGGIYSGSKKFNDTFTKSLQHEYKDKGITFVSLQPGMVRTNMTSGKNKKTNIMYPDYDTYAESVMKTLGKGIETAGYPSHGILRSVITSVPEWILSKALVGRRK